MRPEQLKSPFRWDARHVLIQDRVWFVPKRCPNPDQFIFPGWDASSLFGNHHPVRVEYCSGNGAWIAAKAMAEPQINWVAVEMQFERVRRIWSKIKNFNLSNLIILCGEGLDATSQFFPSHSIQQAFVNFPDPWPKNKHAKNRIIEPKFIAELDRILLHDGMVTVVTDDFPFSEWTIHKMAKSERFVPRYESPHYTIDLPDYGSSTFKELWLSQGKEIRYHIFDKKKAV